jgi:hypothetical protein
VNQDPGGTEADTIAMSGQMMFTGK